jgi:hypothetical protein
VNKHSNIIEFPADPGEALRTGHICLANEGRFEASNLSEALTAFAVGWRDQEDIESTLDFVAPAVPVARRFGYKVATNAEEFMSDTDDIRAIGANFKEIESRGTDVESRTDNKGLVIKLDRDELMPGDEEVHTGRLLRRLLRSELRRAITALAALHGGTGKVWAAGGGTDCDTDVTAALETARLSSGLRGNRVLYGGGAFQLREEAYAGKDKAGAFAGLSLDVDGLARRLRLPNGGVRISNEVFQSAVASKSKVVSDIVMAFYATPGASKEDPSNLKRFYTPTDAGKYRVYRQETAKFVFITVEHYSKVVATSTVGAVRLTITNA